jgi:hypothetical protein
MVARDGIEPPTPAFSGLRSTAAHRPHVVPDRGAIRRGTYLDRLDRLAIDRTMLWPSKDNAGLLDSLKVLDSTAVPASVAAWFRQREAIFNRSWWTRAACLYAALALRPNACQGSEDR